MKCNVGGMERSARFILGVVFDTSSLVLGYQCDIEGGTRHSRSGHAAHGAYPFLSSERDVRPELLRDPGTMTQRLAFAA